MDRNCRTSAQRLLCRAPYPPVRRDTENGFRPGVPAHTGAGTGKRPNAKRRRMPCMRYRIRSGAGEPPARLQIGRTGRKFAPFGAAQTPPIGAWCIRMADSDALQFVRSGRCAGLFPFRFATNLSLRPIFSGLKATNSGYFP